MCSLCLGDFAAIPERAETLDSRLRSVEKEKMEMEGEIDALKQQLKYSSATVATLQEQMLKKTAFFQSQVTKLFDDRKKAKLEVTDKEHELMAAQCKLDEQNVDNEVLRSRYKDAQLLINQLRKLQADLLQQTANIPAREAQLTIVSEQRTGEKAELETDLRNMSQELAKKNEPEKLLKDRLEQAEKDAEQRQLLLQHSEEIHQINSKKEELERKLLADVLVEPYGKDVCHLDNMLTDHSDHSEKGMYVL